MSGRYEVHEADGSFFRWECDDDACADWNSGEHDAMLHEATAHTADTGHEAVVLQVVAWVKP